MALIARCPCPFLPAADALMDFRVLSSLRGGDGAELHLAALRYGQYLWLQGYTARAILAVTRCLHGDLPGDCQLLNEWPIPYQALRWLFRNHPGDAFMGNPRVSFQHQALRVRGPRQAIRQWRCWGVWYLAAMELPALEDDATCARGPTMETILQGLHTHGVRGEAGMWQQSLWVEGNWEGRNDATGASTR
ncbi:MAG: hypothetical protein SFY80_15405 [Verrucomicrobiota bacterium]|nr:hypothetical protein [Verrucomicrobiota bacterium]